MYQYPSVEDRYMPQSEFSEPLDTTSDIIMSQPDVESKPATKVESESGEEVESKFEEDGKNNLATIFHEEPEASLESTEGAKLRIAFRLSTDVSTEKLWAIAEDFCNLEWCSVVTGSVLLEGEGRGNTVGAVRRCTNDKVRVPWFSDEKLVAIDHEKLTLTYEVVGTNLGLLNYRATLSVGSDQDGENFVELKGEQSPRDSVSEEECLEFMNTEYGKFVTDLESKARTLHFEPVNDISFL